MNSLLSETQRQQLILDHYDQVRRVALSLSRRLPSHIEVDDLIGWGLLGLLQAIEHHDPSRPLAPLAELYIRGAIVDALRQQGIRRSVLQAGQKLDRCSQRLRQELGRAPSTSELADTLGVSAPKLQKIRASAVAPVAVRDPEIWEELSGEEETVEDRLFAHQRKKQLEGWISELCPREQAVIRASLEGTRCAETAASLGVSEGRVSQIYQSASQKLLRLAGVPAGRRAASSEATLS